MTTSTEAASPDDEQWEYEYDEREKDEFFFTLDLTTHDPNALAAKQYFANGVEKSSAADVGPNDVPQGLASDLIQHPAVNEHGAPNELQALDLHTKSPLIKFGDRIYSCYWLTDLGTQIYVSNPNVVANPLRPGNVVDVIGMSQARLVGMPATLHPLEESSDEDDAEGTTSSNAITVDDGADGEDELSELSTSTAIQHQTGQPLVIPRKYLRHPSLEQQASFLERLSTIKLKKGEVDNIPMYSVKHYTPPANKAQLRQQALAADAEKARMKSKLSMDSSFKLKRSRPTFSDLGLQTKASRRLPKRSKHGASGPGSHAAMVASLGFEGGPTEAQCLPPGKNS